MNPTISTIIVNFNAGDLLRSCIESIRNCPLDIEIIVVDNASTDGSLDTLAQFSDVQIIRNFENLGFATACNRGLKVARADNLLFLNPDCTFYPGTLTELLNTLRSSNSVGMVGAMLTNLDGTEQAGGRRAIPTPWRSFVRAFGLVRFSHRWPRLFFDFHLHKLPKPETPIEVEAISGACMLVKREAVQDVGEWDEGYFLHCEDLDWCMRFRQKNWQIIFVPSARIAHEQGFCSRDRRLFVEWHKHKGMIRFYKKFFQNQYPGGLMGFVTIGVWLRFGLVTLALMFKRLAKAYRFESTKTNNPAVFSQSSYNKAQLLKNKNSEEEIKTVGVLGASSLVGTFMLPLLKDAGWKVLAYSRRHIEPSPEAEWRLVYAEQKTLCDGEESIPYWICLAPIWVLPDYFEMILQSGARRIVVLSSTSRFAKAHSSDIAEQALVRRMEAGETGLRTWAEAHGIEWVVLRPTLIYGHCLDKNITEITRFIRRFGFFPLFGNASGLRQPIYAKDVALSCIATVTSPATANRTYNISGKEIISYREMVSRVFAALGRTPRFVSIPLWTFRIAVACVSLFPRYRKWSPAMAERMNQDLVFDHSDAMRDFGFNPKPFVLTSEDVAQ